MLSVPDNFTVSNVDVQGHPLIGAAAEGEPDGGRGMIPERCLQLHCTEALR